MPSLMDILRGNAGMTGSYTPGSGVGSSGVPAGTNGYDYGSGTDAGDFWRNIALGNTGNYSNTTKNYLGTGGAGWDPAAASAGYLAANGGPDNAIGFNAWMSGNPQYTAAFGAPPPTGTTFDQFRTGIGKGGPNGYQNNPTLYNPPAGAPGAAGGGAGGGYLGPPNPAGPGNSAASGPLPTNQPSGNVPSAAGTGPVGQPDWSKIDVSKFLDPNLQFTMGLGQQAINNSAAAKGGLLSGANLKGLADYTTGMANNAYANAQNAAFNDRNFMRGAYQNDRDYQTALDQWNQNFAQNQYQFNTGANQWQQNFTQNQNQWDQQFGYNAALNDRNFNYNSLMDLARMGEFGTSGNADLASQLARLLSANTIASGQAGASGTLGGSNAINSIISQLLGMYQSNQWMGNVFPNGQ